MIRTLLIFSFLFLLFSCKKSDPIITIQAKDILTGEGSAFEDFYFFVEERKGTFISSSSVVADGTFNESGFVSFELDVSGNNRWYYLGLGESPDELPDDVYTVEYWNDIEVNNNFPNITIRYWKKAAVKVMLNNVDFTNEMDNITYSFRPVAPLENPIISDSHNGNTDSYENDFKTIPSGNFECTWDVTRDGVTTSYSDNFSVGNGDSLVYTIDY